MESRSRNLRRAVSRAATTVIIPHKGSAGEAAAQARRQASRSSTSARTRFVSSSMSGWRAASSPCSTRRRCAASAARCSRTGLLAPDAVDKALTSLQRFHALCKIQQVGRVYAIATAACRDATNGPDFIAKAERICGVKIEILSGPREAKLSALGVVSGIHKPDGIVGDLGGGSLELIDVRGHQVRGGVTLPLGSLALQDLAHKSLKRAERIVKNELSELPRLKSGRGRTFYAVGGTWRALARIHIIQSGYPLKVMHGYTIPARRCARLRAAAAPARRRQHAGRHRGGRRRAPPASDLRRAGAGIHHPHRAAEDDHVLDLRRPRRPALFDAAGGRAQQGRPHLRRADAERAAVALGAPCAGTDRMDRPPGAGRALARDRGGPPAASCRLPVVRHRLARASRPSRRADAGAHHQRQFRLGQPSGPRLRRAVGVLPLCRPFRGEPAAADHPGAGVAVACSSAPACSARPSASRI